MDRRRDDPEYQLHDPVRPAADEAPPPGATGPRSTGARPAEENTPREVNRRLNMGARAPSEVRETQREHGPESPGAEEEEGIG